MLWIKLTLFGVVLMVLTGGVVKVTSFVADKDHQIEQREQTIAELNAKVAGLRTDLERMQASNASLEQDLRRKIEEAAKARQEAAVLRAADTQSVLRQRDRSAVRGIAVDPRAVRAWVLGPRELDLHDAANGRLIAHYAAPAGMLLEGFEPADGRSLRVRSGGALFEPRPGCGCLARVDAVLTGREMRAP